MEHMQKVKAIHHIRPNAEFTLDGDEIVWQDENQTKPTNKQIESGWVSYQAAQEIEAQTNAAAKAAAQAKLEALGLTVEDLKALGL